jgi:hypothetical protein
MRTIKLIFIIPCLLAVFSACQKDNYKAPDATVSGALTDAEIGGPLSLPQNGQGGTIRYLVNDLAKYPTPTGLDLTMFKDGTYTNTQMFAEKYQVWPLDRTGPWQYTKATAPAYAPTANPLTLLGDTLNVTVAAGANTVTNFKVYPYFRITISVVDTSVTCTITRSAAATAANNNLTVAPDLIVYVNNYPNVHSGVSSNNTGYYINQWRFNVSNTSAAGQDFSGTQTTKTIVFGVPFTLPSADIMKPPVPPSTVSPGVNVVGIKWAVTHLPKGTYYWRASIVGAGSNGQANYSNTVQAIVH